MASGDLKKLAKLTMDLAAKGPLSARVLNANNTFHVITVPKREYIEGIKNAVPSLTDEEAEKIHETLILLLLKHENTTYAEIESGRAGKEISLRGEKQKSLFTPHAIRHGVISRLLNEGTPIQDISKSIARHSKIGTTYDIYGHIQSGKGKSILDTLSNEKEKL